MSREECKQKEQKQLQLMKDVNVFTEQFFNGILSGHAEAGDGEFYYEGNTEISLPHARRIALVMIREKKALIDELKRLPFSSKVYASLLIHEQELTKLEKIREELK